MDDAQQFILAATQAGYGCEAAAVALAWARARMEQGGLLARLYIFRSSGSGGRTTEQAQATRPRVLLAFRSADAALSFAQSNGLGTAPRLVALSFGQLLAALIQRPTITALLIAAEVEGVLRAGLPDGLRIERTALLDQLQIADCRL